MLYTSALAAAVAVAPLAQAHGGGLQIMGLHPKDLKARSILSELGIPVGRSSGHANSNKIEARQNTDGQCGAGYGSCAPGVCCSQSGCTYGS
jgi:hypothetical protein